MHTKKTWLLIINILGGIAVHPFTWHRRIAVLGAIFFCLQTVVLDAIVWVSYFSL